MINSYFLASRQALTATLYRFPVAVIASILFTMLALNKSFIIPHKETYLYALCCVVFISVSFRLDLRRHSVQWLNNILAPLMGLFIFLHYKDVNPYSPQPITFLAGLFLVMTIMPYIFSNKDDAFIWEYNKTFWQRIGLTAVASAILILGSGLIIFTLKTLFGIHFRNDIFLDVLTVIMGGFAPIFAMAGIPTSFSEPQEEFPKGIKTVINYIAVPLLLIYAAILYGYILKIMVALSLPRGNVAYLVSTFGAASVAVYLVAFPLWEKSSGVMGWFGRHFFKCMLPPLFLLALALKTRIQDYGVTESRYLLGLVFIWLLSATVAIVLKMRHKVQIILTMLPLLLIGGTIGPWSMKKVSGHSQVQRLKEILEKNEILEEGRIKAIRKPLDRPILLSVSSIVTYLIASKKTNELQQWFGKGVPMEASTLLSRMGQKYVSRYGYTPSYSDKGAREYVFYTETMRKDHEPIKVSGYDFLLNVNYPIFSAKGQIEEFLLEDKKHSLKLKLNLNTAYTLLKIVNVNNSKVITFDLSKVIEKSMLKNQFSPNKLSKEFIFTQSNEDIEVTLVLDRVSGYFAGEKLMLEEFKGHLLFKIMQKN